MIIEEEEEKYCVCVLYMWQRQLMMTNAMESEYKRDLQDSQGYQKKKL